MKYIPLSSLQNSYSSVSKYRIEPNGVSIDGFYKENSLNIPTLDFDTLGVIPGTSFRFIVRIFDSEGSQNSLNTFTSDGYYSDLLRARNSGNPYFINTALNPSTFVKMYLDSLKQTFERRIEEEILQGVSVIFNNLFNADGSVDYQRLGEYIDWASSKPKLDDIIDNGILNSNEISAFNINPPIRSIDDEDVIDIDTNDSIDINDEIDDEIPSNNGGDIEVPDTNDIINPNDDIVIEDRVIIDNNEYFILSPNNPTTDNLPQGGNQGNQNPFLNPGGNPDEDLSNEYTVRYRNIGREL